MNANEAEARAAMKIATRLMSQHSVTQAELIDNEKVNEREKRGGFSLVKITHSREGGRALNWTWAEEVVSAVTELFDCDAFSSQSDQCVAWSFYGIAEHTVFAAMSFEMIHNLILDWADAYSTVQARNSYCLGVANGLDRLAKKERFNMEKDAWRNEQKAMATRRRKEEPERQKTLARLNDRQSSPITAESFFEDSSVERSEADIDRGGGFDNYDDDDETLDANAGHLEQHAASMPELTGDLEADMAAVISAEVKSELKQEHLKQEDDEDTNTSLPALHNLVSSSQPHIKTEAPIKLVDECKSSLQSSSRTQLARFRENTAAIEADVLRAQGIRLYKQLKRKRSVKDYAAYQHGQHDSKRIDLRVATIEEGRSSA